MREIVSWTGYEALLLRKAMRSSQRDFARKLGVSARLVPKWEEQLADITPTVESQQILDTTLDLAPADVQERFFASLSAGTAVRRRGSGRSLLVDAHNPRGRAKDEQASEVGDLTQHYETLLIDYAALDNALGPRPVVKMISQHAHFLEEQASEATDGQQWAAIMRMATRYAEFAGWLYQDSGDSICAAQWTEKALGWAHACGDRALVAYILMRRSNQAVEAGDARLGVGMAEAALSSQGAASVRVMALGLRQRAAGLALVGDGKGAMDAYQAARECLASDPEWNPLTGYCTSPYLDAEAAVCNLRLRQPEAAVELLTSAMQTWPDGYARDRAYYQSHLVMALVRAGLYDDALGVAEPAAQAGRRFGSQRTLTQLRSVAGVLETHRHVDEAAALLQWTGDADARQLRAGSILTS